LHRNEASQKNQNLLSIKDLTVKYRAFGRETFALSGVNFNVRRSEIVAIVGESGSGKSTLGLSILKLLPSESAEYVRGEINYENSDLLKLDESSMTLLRGTKISMIFQDPMSSLDPVYRIGDQMMEVFQIKESRYNRNNRMDQRDADEENSKFNAPPSTDSLRRNDLLHSLRTVQISDPEQVMRKYPHELSGGMAQRVMIAQALIEKPALLIADEPTSSLDVTTQAQVLSLMKNLRDEIGTSIILITHDLAVAAQLADRVVVMYAGEICEDASTREIFYSTLHPYTEGLIQSYPDHYKEVDELDSIG